MHDHDARLREVEQRLNSHEEVCAFRYKEIARAAAVTALTIEKMQATLVKIGLTIMAGLAGILIKLVIHA